MTKKDYVILAKAIMGLDEEITRREVARKIAEALKEDNPRFDHNKFYKTCGF